MKKEQKKREDAEESAIKGNGRKERKRENGV